MSWLIFNSVPHTHSYIIDAKNIAQCVREWEEREKKREVCRVNANNRDKRLEKRKMLNFVPPSLNFRPMCSMWGSLILNRIRADEKKHFGCFLNSSLGINFFFSWSLQVRRKWANGSTWASQAAAKASNANAAIVTKW